MKIVNPLKQLPGDLNFLREVKTEGMRVNWPTREKTIKDTIIVIGFAVAIAVFLSAFDYVFQSILDRFLL